VVRQSLQVGVEATKAQLARQLAFLRGGSIGSSSARQPNNSFGVIGIGGSSSSQSQSNSQAPSQPQPPMVRHGAVAAANADDTTHGHPDTTGERLLAGRKRMAPSTMAEAVASNAVSAARSATAAALSTGSISLVSALSASSTTAPTPPSAQLGHPDRAAQGAVSAAAAAPEEREVLGIPSTITIKSTAPHVVTAPRLQHPGTSSSSLAVTRSLERSASASTPTPTSVSSSATSSAPPPSSAALSYMENVRTVLGPDRYSAWREVLRVNSGAASLIQAIIRRVAGV
jgi:hypothetical protein